jgi:hypothetical protein
MRTRPRDDEDGRTKPAVERDADSKCTVDELVEFALTLEDNEAALAEIEDFAAKFAASQGVDLDAVLDELTSGSGLFDVSGAAGVGSLISLGMAAIVAAMM